MSEAVTRGSATPGGVGALAGRTLLVGGATSAAGRAMARAAIAAGAVVVATGRDESRLAELREAVPGVRTVRADVTREDEVTSLRESVHDRFGPLDGVVPLVGGWRGGGGIAGQREEDLRVLEASFAAVRHLTRAFFDDIAASSAGRVVVVSSTSVERPLAGGAAYASVKAAAETWTRAVAHGLTKNARDAGRELEAAAFVVRVASLEGRESALADLVVSSWRSAPSETNGTIVTLGDDMPSAARGAQVTA